MIFLSYRRDDDRGFAHALYERIASNLSEDDVFMDVQEPIRPGTDFVRLIAAQIAACDALLAVIGPRWRMLMQSASADDFVSLEISTALRLGKRVIPVLVNGASMPKADELPGCLRRLVRLQAVNIRPDSFASDTRSLIAWLKELPREKRTPSDDEKELRGGPGSTVEKATSSIGPPAPTRRYPLWRRWGSLRKTWEIAVSTMDLRNERLRANRRPPRASQ